VTLVIKYVFQHSGMQPIGLAWVRVVIGFIFLFVITLFWDRRGLWSLATRDLLQLGLVGFLGVFSYAIAAWGLMYSSVIHYALIYSLLPSCTATLSVLMGKDQMSLLKAVGIALSLIGCVVAVYHGAPYAEASFQFGDVFILLFTLMMSAHIVLSSGIVKRFGVMVSNTVMFGISAFLLFLGSLEWPEPRHEEISPLIMGSVVYVGCATAAVFLLRYRSLQSLSPATVGTYHNLIPVCTITLAYLYLGESLCVQTILGGAMVVAGAEVVRRASLPHSGFSLFLAKLWSRRSVTQRSSD
jgi:drug/metabolite transporter (DMT)-like permease